MENIAIIDIGSNSIRLIIAEISDDKNKRFKIIDDVKKTVKLGKGMENSPYIKADRIKKGVSTLKKFKDICDNYNTKDIVAFATAAVRRAVNRDIFLHKVKRETNIDIDILRGKDEAYYDYLGVINSLDINNGLMMDIGGGSIELGWIKDKKLNRSISLPFGYLDLSNQFDIRNSISETEEIILINFLMNKFNSVSWLKNIKSSNFIGVGGSIRNIAKIDRRLKKSRDLKLHNYHLNNLDVLSIYNLIKSKNLKERKKIKGLSKKRAKYFIGALAAVVTIINFCGLSNIITSRSGIREGRIYSYLQPAVLSS